MKIIYSILIILVPVFAFAHGGGGDEGAKIGKGIVAYEEDAGFKLSQESQKRMKFTYKKVEKEGAITIPKEALVLALNEKHIYLHRSDFFKAVDVVVSSKSKDSVTVSSSQLKVGTEVAIQGVSFLRVIDMDLNGGEEDEHGEHSEHGEKEHSEQEKHND